MLLLKWCCKTQTSGLPIFNFIFIPVIEHLLTYHSLTSLLDKLTLILLIMWILRVDIKELQYIQGFTMVVTKRRSYSGIIPLCLRDFFVPFFSGPFATNSFVRSTAVLVSAPGNCPEIISILQESSCKSPTVCAFTGSGRWVAPLEMRKLFKDNS